MPPAFVNRLRSNSIPLNTIPPKATAEDYSPELATLATRILYPSPLRTPADLPIYILNSAALPNAKQEYYDKLLPYVLDRLPDEEQLIGGLEYVVVFFAGGDPSSNNGTRRRRRSSKSAQQENSSAQQEQEMPSTSSWGPSRGSQKPGFAWFMRAYNVLSRAMRKRLKKLYIVHEKRWVRVLFEMFATVVSPKFRKKVVHVSSLTALAFQIPIENLLIPPSAYLTDRKHVASIDAPYASGKRAFGSSKPFPTASKGQIRLPRVLREATRFLLTENLIETEGLFRISARQQTVEILRESFDRGQKFIVWRDMNTFLTFPVHREGFGDVQIEESVLKQVEGYDVHTAAAIIKLWYKELKDPIFPQSSYQALSKFYGDPATILDFGTLKQMLDPGVEYTVLPPLSRQILTQHLLPLLSDVAAHSEVNKMTATNLAVCFSPILLRGPDPIEDVYISAIIRNILTSMIEKWTDELAPALDLTNERLSSLLQLPEDPADREDPLDEASLHRHSIIGQRFGSLETQVSGIVLADNEINNTANEDDDDGATSSEVPIEASSSSDSDSDSDFPTRPPPLPPRPSASTLDPLLPRKRPSPPPTTISAASAGSSTTMMPPSSIPRKPAPPVPVPPRYSTIITADPLSFTHPTRRRTDSGPTGTIDPEILSMHRGSVATLPPYEEEIPIASRHSASLPPPQIPSTVDTGAGVGEGGGGGSGVRDALEEAIASPLSAGSVGSIPRKPVGEGKLGAKGEGDKGG